MTEGMKLARLYTARKSLIKEKVRHQVALFLYLCWRNQQPGLLSASSKSLAIMNIPASISSSSVPGFTQGQNSNDIPQRMYSKLELAQLYFPDAIDKSVARRHLMAWIQQCVPLWQNIQRMGYRKGSQFFTPRMVKCIVDYLGEPG